MRHWEQRLETLTRRTAQLAWWVFDLAALLAIGSLPLAGLLGSASMAGNLLLIASVMLLWRETAKAVLA